MAFGASRYFTLQMTTEGEETLERITNFCTKKKRHFDKELNPAKNICLLKAVSLNKDNPVGEQVSKVLTQVNIKAQDTGSVYGSEWALDTNAKLSF